MGSELVNGIPLMAVVFGCVEFCKKLGLAGRSLTVASLGIGVAAGVAYRCSIALPATFADGFADVLYGVALGLAASGVYDFVSARWPKT